MNTGECHCLPVHTVQRVGEATCMRGNEARADSCCSAGRGGPPVCPSQAGHCPALGLQPQADPHSQGAEDGARLVFPAAGVDAHLASLVGGVSGQCQALTPLEALGDLEGLAFSSELRQEDP